MKLPLAILLLLVLIAFSSSEEDGYTGPSITYLACVQADLCLNVKFADNGEDERILFKKVVDCVYSGTFEGSNVFAAATFESCPSMEIIEVISKLLIDYIGYNLIKCATGNIQP